MDHRQGPIEVFCEFGHQVARIDVDTKNGVVTLNGAVGTPAARDMAMNLARETDGVTRVVNNLKMNPSLK